MNRRPTILVVEDELIIALDMKGILEQEGYNVIINIVTVNQAIQAIEEHNPVLVLIDINLNQEKDGVNLGQYLLKKDTIPFIYITSYTDNLTLERVKETHPNGFIVKPFKPIDFKTTVAIVLSNYKFKTEAIENSGTVKEDEIPFVLKNIVTYITDNIDEKIDIQELSAKSRWKHQHFIRVFTKYIGETPYQFILKKKIEKAKKLLMETNIPTLEIGYELGFLSYSNFSNAFKKDTGKTPDAYRKFYSVKSQID
jgi:AraC-like DNA-binding protein/CheY-like chemotaxis protein